MGVSVRVVALAARGVEGDHPVRDRITPRLELGHVPGRVRFLSRLLGCIPAAGLSVRGIPRDAAPAVQRGAQDPRALRLLGLGVRMNRWIWVDSGQAADYRKAQPEGINGFFFDMFATSKAELQKVWQDGYVVGVYMAGNWPQFAGLTGKGVAERVALEIERLKFGGAAKPKVQFDLEMHGPADGQFLIDCFQRWRELAPTRDTSWTMEGHQGGWIKAQPGLVAAVQAARIRVVPQCYDADMQGGLWDTHEMARDLVRAGFTDASISCFHDAKYLDQQKWWTGFAFTQQRLP